LQCWEDFEKQEKGNYCFIFEDDTTIQEDLLDKVKNILSKITTKWGFINLGASYDSAEKFNLKI
jgi:GR25 family glycosyltransferase involved in LPS biosynthesis